MAIETFLIILNALVSLNISSEGQGQPKSQGTEIMKKDVRPTSSNADICRGGWDAN